MVPAEYEDCAHAHQPGDANPVEHRAHGNLEQRIRPEEGRQDDAHLGRGEVELGDERLTAYPNNSAARNAIKPQAK
jgi:hypothetical protein